MDDMNKFSCNECKRRRIKCSREIPVCSPCVRNKRHCLYERPLKTPLTRKHLTEVEKELSLVRQIVSKYFPNLDIPVVLQQLKNGTDIDEIPNFDEYLEALPKKKQKSSPQTDETVITNDMSIASLLVQTTESSKHVKRAYSQTYQIPQLLPSTVDHDTVKNPAESTSPASTTSGRKFTWDERRRSESDRRPSIIDGMATTQSNGYLGAASSAALINMVCGGLFFHDRARKSRNISDACSPASSVSSLSREAPSAQTIERYIHKYFETYHVSYPIIHQPLFLAQLNEIVAPPPGWDSLKYIVAAIGSFMSATGPEENDDLTLFELAKRNLSIDDLETGNLVLVQTLTLMSNYLQKRDRPNSGYNYLGLAVRMALGLGMHKDLEDPEESLLTQEIRRRIWWCLYVFDCGQTITYGRPLGTPCAGIDSKLPLNVVDSSLTAATRTPPTEELAPTVHTSVRFQSLFHLLTNSIYERIITDPFPPAQSLLTWDEDYIMRWEQEIPSYFTASARVPEMFKLAHAVLHWRCRNLRIIMYRTFLLKKVLVNAKPTHNDLYETRAGEICLSECKATISSMNEYWNEKTNPIRMDAWYSLFFLIPAVVMPLVCLRNDPLVAESSDWVDDVLTARSIIERIMVICPPASKILDLINTLSSGYLNKDMEQVIVNEQPIESPLSQLMQLHSMLWPGSFDIEQQFL